MRTYPPFESVSFCKPRPAIPGFQYHHHHHLLFPNVIAHIQELKRKTREKPVRYRRKKSDRDLIFFLMAYPSTNSTVGIYLAFRWKG